nr:MAG TPA: hypothetical protein [Caudoviricetes sp.]
MSDRPLSSGAGAYLPVLFRLTRMLPPTPPSTPRAAATRSRPKASGQPPVGLGWGSSQPPL